MKLTNLTPHAVVLYDGGRPIMTIPPSGSVARVAMYRHLVGEIHIPEVALRLSLAEGGYFEAGELASLPYSPDVLTAVPVCRSIPGQVEGLPAPEDDVRYIVSRVVAEACRDREDLLIPDDTVRDGDGRIVGCRAFARV